MAWGCLENPEWTTFPLSCLTPFGLQCLSVAILLAWGCLENPELEDSKSVFLHDTLAHDVASSLVTEGSAAEEIWSTLTFTGILNLFCDLDLDHNRAIRSFHKTIHLMIMYHQTKLSCKRISSSDNILKSHIFILSLTVTLILKTANQSFWKTIWLIMMHHHTTFGGNRFSSSEDAV